MSTLICSGQITKEEALIELELPLYIKTDFKNDKDYVLKKLGFSEVYFDQLMLKEPVPHDSFEVEGSLFYYYPILKPLKPYWEFFKKNFKKFNLEFKKKALKKSNLEIAKKFSGSIEHEYYLLKSPFSKKNLNKRVIKKSNNFKIIIFPLSFSENSIFTKFMSW